MNILDCKQYPVSSLMQENSYLYYSFQLSIAHRDMHTKEFDLRQTLLGHFISSHHPIQHVVLSQLFVSHIMYIYILCTWCILSYAISEQVHDDIMMIYQHQSIWIYVCVKS